MFFLFVTVICKILEFALNFKHGSVVISESNLKFRKATFDLHKVSPYLYQASHKQRSAAKLHLMYSGVKKECDLVAQNAKNSLF